MLVPEYETKLMVGMMPSICDNPDAVATIERWVRDRAAMVRAGRLAPADDKQSLFASARAFAESGPYYMPVLHFRPGPEMQLDRNCIEFIRSCDMSRYTPAEYFAMKEEAAAKKRAENEKAAENNMLARVDSMSNAAIHEFLEVSRAIQTGETIVAHGDDLKLIERLAEDGKKAEMDGDPIPGFEQAMNPGQHPFLNKEKTVVGR